MVNQLTKPVLPEAPGIDSGSGQISSDQAVKGKAEKKSGRRIGFNYIILKSLKESQKNDVVKCLYIKSLTNFGICVIKEGTYGDSKDKEGRDIKDKLIWQKQLHEQLQNKLRLPKYLGSFEENGNYYLVIERIKGKPLYRICREKSKEIREGLISGNKTGMIFLDYMSQLTALLEKLHDNQVVHRDVSSNNFIITPSGKVAVIDMELSYSLDRQFPSPPFQLGTYGYMSPQQESMQPPSVTDDIFSLGAIFLEVWTGIAPRKLSDAPIEELSKKVYFFLPDRGFADIIIRCLNPEPDKRPTLKEVRGAVENYKRDLRVSKQRSHSVSAVFTKKEILETIQRAINTHATPLLVDEKLGWFSEDMNKPAINDKKKINKAWYASFNKGGAGILYMLSKAHRAGFDISVTTPYIQKALELIEKKYISRITAVSPSLHFGASGIAVCLAAAVCDELIDPQPIHFEWINQLISVENTGPDFINGIAGQGLAHGLCYPFIHEEQARERLADYVYRLLKNQQKDGSWLHEKDKTKRIATKGFNRGAAGIIYFLLEYARQYEDRVALTGAERGLNWLIKTAVYEKASIQWRSSTRKSIPAWFSEGPPGIALAFMKAYSLLGELKYKKYAEGALLSNPAAILDNNLGQSQGLSGIGEIYLEAFHVFKDPIWLERAGWIAQVIMQLKKVHKEHGPYWLIDHERQPVPDFVNGNSGVVHFLVRYCHPDKIPFPLFDDGKR